MQLLVVNGVVAEFIENIKGWLTGFIDMIAGKGGLFPSLAQLFYTPESGLTVFGVLGLMGIAVGLIYLGINFVRHMFKA